MYTPEVNAEAIRLRQLAADGNLSRDDLRNWITKLREGRAVAAGASAKASTKKAAATAKKNINPDDLLSELEGL